MKNKYCIWFLFASSKKYLSGDHGVLLYLFWTAQVLINHFFHPGQVIVVFELNKHITYRHAKVHLPKNI